MHIDAGFATLLVGLAGVVVAGALLGVILWMRRTARTRISTERLDELVIAIGSHTQESAASRVGDAAAARGQRRTALPLPRAIGFGRVLWVNNDPDSTMSETVAFESLGISVTKTMHADIALAYLSGLEYVAVIAEIVDASNPDAVGAFFEAVRDARPGIITLGYAAPESTHPPQISGAPLIRDPADLVNAVVSALAAER